MKNNYLADFYHDGVYHVYNRTNNKELLFKSDNDREQFLNLYVKYLQPFLDTFSWCLLPNHFHFLTRVKPEQEIKNTLTSLPQKLLKPTERKYLRNEIATELLIEFEWKRFFISYSMFFNKQYKRKGNLFHRPFKRLEVKKESHFTEAIVYIHSNPLKHKLCGDFTTYPWSSWHTMISKKPTILCRDEVLDWFGGLQPFIDAHKNLSKYYCNTDITTEENALIHIDIFKQIDDI
jgi:putative transposase